MGGLGGPLSGRIEAIILGTVEMQEVRSKSGQMQCVGIFLHFPNDPVLRWHRYLGLEGVSIEGACDLWLSSIQGVQMPYYVQELVLQTKTILCLSVAGNSN